MIAAKFFKSFLLLIFVFIFIVLAILFQLYLTCDRTLLSGSYFEKTFIKNDVALGITEYAQDILDDAEADSFRDASPELQGIVDSSRRFLEESGFAGWAESEIPILAEGIYSYMTGHGESLPVIGLEPLKVIFVKFISSRVILESAGSAEKLESFISVIREIDDRYPDKTKAREDMISLLESLELFEELEAGDAAVGVIADMIIEADEGTRVEDIFTSAVDELIEKNLGIEDMSSEFDLNIFIDKLYVSEEGPVYEIARLAGSLRKDVYFLFIIVLSGMILMISATAYFPKSISGWLGSGFFISGISVLAASRSHYVKNNILDEALANLAGGSGNGGLQFLKDWIVSYVDGIHDMAFVISIFAAFAGMLLIVAGILMPSAVGRRRKDGEDDPKSGKKPLVVLVRISIVLSAAALTAVIAAGQIDKIENNINKLGEVIEEAGEDMSDINTVLDDMLNTTIFTDLASEGSE